MSRGIFLSLGRLSYRLGLYVPCFGGILASLSRSLPLLYVSMGAGLVCNVFYAVFVTAFTDAVVEADGFYKRTGNRDRLFRPDEVRKTPITSPSIARWAALNELVLAALWGATLVGTWYVAVRA